MTISTIAIGFKTVLMRTPWQNWAIVVFCPLVATIFQGVQIDTDHWRHFYLLLGIVVIIGVSTAFRFYFVSWLGERVVGDIRVAVQQN